MGTRLEAKPQVLVRFECGHLKNIPVAKEPTTDCDAYCRVCGFYRRIVKVGV